MPLPVLIVDDRLPYPVALHLRPIIALNMLFGTNRADDMPRRQSRKAIQAIAQVLGLASDEAKQSLMDAIFYQFTNWPCESVSIEEFKNIINQEHENSPAFNPYQRRIVEVLKEFVRLTGVRDTSGFHWGSMETWQHKLLDRPRTSSFRRHSLKSIVPKKRLLALLMWYAYSKKLTIFCPFLYGNQYYLLFESAPIVAPELPVALVRDRRGIHAVILGKACQEKLSNSAFKVFTALVVAGEKGLSGVDLRHRSGAGDYRGILRRALDGPDGKLWRLVLELPGDKSGVYRICHPGSPSKFVKTTQTRRKSASS